jgi:hypothetical protein
MLQGQFELAGRKMAQERAIRDQDHKHELRRRRSKRQRCRRGRAHPQVSRVPRPFPDLNTRRDKLARERRPERTERSPDPACIQAILLKYFALTRRAERRNARNAKSATLHARGCTSVATRAGRPSKPDNRVEREPSLREWMQGLERPLPGYPRGPGGGYAAEPDHDRKPDPGLR